MSPQSWDFTCGSRPFFALPLSRSIISVATLHSKAQGEPMERKRLEKEPEAGSLPRLSAPSIPASTNSPAQGAHAPEAMLDPSAGLDREHPSWIGGRLAMKMP